jgi:hypothetical protein
MSNLIWIFGFGVVSLVAEKVMKEMGQENKAQAINIASNTIILLLVIKMVYSLLSDTMKMFGLR